MQEAIKDISVDWALINNLINNNIYNSGWYTNVSGDWKRHEKPGRTTTESEEMEITITTKKKNKKELIFNKKSKLKTDEKDM